MPWVMLEIAVHILDDNDKKHNMWPSLGKTGLTKFALSRFWAQRISKRWNAFKNILNAFWNVCNVPQRKLKTFHTIEKSFQNIQKTFTNVD